MPMGCRTWRTCGQRPAASDPSETVSVQPSAESAAEPAEPQPAPQPQARLAAQLRTVILEESAEVESAMRADVGRFPNAPVRVGRSLTICCAGWRLWPANVIAPIGRCGSRSCCSNCAIRPVPADEQAGAITCELRTAAGEVDARVPQIAECSVAIELLRVRHSLVRRLDVWELMPVAFSQQITVACPSHADIKRLAACWTPWTESPRRPAPRATVAALPGHGLAARLTRTPSSYSDSEVRRVAGEIQTRLSRTDLSDGQCAFIGSRPVAELAAALRPWSLDPFDPARLLADLEHFESTNQPSDARRVADDYIESISLVTNGADLSQRLETNYRNANVRFALTEKLLKRLLPGASMSTDPVRDQILGHPTRGTSTTSTTVNVKLVPDGQRLRVELEASGQVLANMRSTSGPATLHTQSNSMYLAQAGRP